MIEMRDGGPGSALLFPPAPGAGPEAAGPAPGDPLAAALLDSRARWRDLALLGAELVFETDAAGRLSFVAPARALGHDAAALLGRPAAWLRAESEGPDPFDPAAPPRGMRAWLRTGAGGAACLDVTAIPLAGGLRGVARDVTEEERRAEATGRTLRRATALVRLLGAAQRSSAEGGAASAALARLLEGIRPALGCTGAALVEAEGRGWRIAMAAGRIETIPALPDPPAAGGPPEVAPRLQGGLALVPVAPGLKLAAWRDPPPDEEDLGVLAALGPCIAGLHADAVRQRELDRAARTDPLTGLLNRRGFAEALGAGRAGRLRGVLAYVDMDGLKRLNDHFGHAAGDAGIRAIAARIAAAAGPGDIGARLGGDEFALWLPGAGLEEARARCAPVGAPGPLPGLPAAGPEAVMASIGLAEANPEDTAELLIARADAAMYVRKQARTAA